MTTSLLHALATYTESYTALPINKCPFGQKMKKLYLIIPSLDMHCWFYKDFPVNAYQRLIQQNTGLTWVVNKVQESLQYMNYSVHLLGNVLNHATMKFSAQGDSRYSVVTFSFHQGKCFTKCADQICCALMLNRKKDFQEDYN